MDLKEKYGEWGIVLGATEGVGEAFCKKLAEGGMNIVMVGRREELMREKAEKFKAEYGVDYKVVRADLSEPDEACEKIFAATEDLDMGFMSYVACLHHFGRFQEVDLETHEKCLNVNVISFLRIFHHYMQEFAAKDRGAVINVSSMTGISGSPFNGEYGAGKAYILKLTEGGLAAVSCTSQGAAACSRTQCCEAKPMWDRLDKMIDDFFEEITLADLIKDGKA